MIVTADAVWTFTATGAAGTFNVPAPVFDTTALGCYAISASSDARYNVTYSVTLAADRSGATVSIAAGLTAGDEVVVYRVALLTQKQNLDPSGPFPTPKVDRVIDRLLCDVQATWADASRALRLPVSDDPTGWDLPPASQRAGNLMGFDSDGNPMMVPPTSLYPILPRKRIDTATYNIGPGDNGYRLDVRVDCVLSVGGVDEQWGCMVLHNTTVGDVALANGAGVLLENANDAAPSLHRKIAARGCSVMLYCDEGPVGGGTAHVWIEGATKT